ncbi:MAG: GNAT family N-acetyltransferase [Armatimonadota bacterium]|nr:GNAT family N-acetyltransferase [Armatimonadota bacterium]
MSAILAPRAAAQALSVDRLAPHVARALGMATSQVLEAFRPAAPGDLPAILDLRRAVAGNGLWWDDERFLRWRYFDGMPGSERGPYWVFEHDGRLLGCVGLEPVTLVVDGVPHPSVRSLDIMVHPSVDGLGIGALINLLLFRRYPLMLVTGTSERSRSLIGRMFSEVTALGASKLLLRSRSVLEGRLEPHLAVSIAAPVVDALLRLRRLAGRRVRRYGLRVARLAAFDDDVDALAGHSERAGRIIVRRTSRYLNWRFVSNPRCSHAIFGAFQGNRLAGFIVTRFNTARPNPRGEAEIVDWLVDDEASPEEADAVMAALLEAGLGYLERQGASIVRQLTSDAESQRRTRGHGFVLRPDERLPFFIHAEEAALHQRLARGGWYLTGCDFDVD